MKRSKNTWESFTPQEWDSLQFHGYTPSKRQVRRDSERSLWMYISSGIKVLALLIPASEAHLITR